MQRFTYPSVFTLVICFFVTLIGSCVSHDLDQYVCPSEDISYANEVRPIVISKCAISGCHNGDNGEGRNWNEFDKFQQRASTVKGYVVDHVMPPASSPAGPLSQEQINIISCWVDQGAKNN